MPAATVNIYEAKTHLSKLVDRAAAGEDVVIARNGTPVAKLTHLDAGGHAVTFGVLEGHIDVPGDFDAPLPDDVIAEFHGDPAEG